MFMSLGIFAMGIPFIILFAVMKVIAGFLHALFNSRIVPRVLQVHEKLKEWSETGDLNSNKHLEPVHALIGLGEDIVERTQTPTSYESDLDPEDTLLQLADFANPISPAESASQVGRIVEDVGMADRSDAARILSYMKVSSVVDD
ncbi:hypothetical protein EDD86DRAFT_200717 [Gorgonomyces haynaldii]|nr:hypothetical protein EDD86DRAFT_200717 [Gorgonomyces haynaldii]